MRLAPLLVLALLAAAVFWLWDSWAVYPLKLLVVHFHECGHALATLLVGGSVDSISIDLAQGGVTRSRIPGSVLAQVAVASGGYLGSMAFGAAILHRAANGSTGQHVLEAVAAFLIVALALWVRDPFTIFFTALMALLLAVLARKLPPKWSRLGALFLGLFSALYALWDIRDDLLLRHSATSDAARLAAATGLPALLWAIVWLLIACAVLWFALRRSMLR